MTTVRKWFWPRCSVLKASIYMGCAVFLFLADAMAQQPNQSTVKLTPETLDFGSHPVDTAAPPQTVTLANTGTLPLRIMDIITSGIDFKQANDCGHTLAPGSFCSIEITFKAAITGPRVATVQILDSDPASPQSVVLTGTGQ